MIIYNTANYSDITAGTCSQGYTTQLTRAQVTEELNGVFELEADILNTDPAAKYAAPGNIIRAKVSPDKSRGEQYFRIYEVTKPLTQLITIKAQHITYDLAKVPVKPFTATGAQNIINAINNNMAVASLCSIQNDGLTNTTAQMELKAPASARQCLGGMEGSLVDLMRAEFRFDGLTAYCMAHRGSDKGQIVKYGVNLTEFSDVENGSNQATAVLGYATIDETTYVGNVYNKTAAEFPAVVIVDFSGNYGSDNLPTVATLTTDAQNYANANNITAFARTLSAQYIDISLTTDANAETIKPELGDTITIEHKPLGVSFKSRIQRTVYNLLLDNFDSVEIGQIQTTLNNLFEASGGGTAEPQDTPRVITPTQTGASGVTIGTLDVARVGNVCTIRLQFTLSGTLSSYTKIIEDLPPAFSFNVLTTAMQSATAWARACVISMRTDGSLYLRYGAAGTYIAQLTYICT